MKTQTILAVWGTVALLVAYSGLTFLMAVLGEPRSLWLVRIVGLLP